MKRTKLIAGLLSCMMCLAMLTIGVWAVASVATLDINGNLKFYPEGLFVQLSGEVYRGNSSTESEMTKLSDPRFNYGPVANFDNIQDELSGNFPLEAWEIGNVAFIPNQRFIKIKVYITNYSDFAITGTPTVTIGGQDISEAIAGLTITSNIDELSSITSNTTVTYELILEATGSTEFSKDLSVSFEFEGIPEPVYEYFTYSGNSIIRLSDDYLNLETKPETLVIPSRDKEGNNITAISGNSIGSTFNGLESSNVIIQEGITSIGDSAFKDCTSLERIEIPNSVTYIEYYAFDGCSSLMSIEIPSSVTSIGASFSGCSSLQITVVSDNANYSSDNGSLYNKDKTTLIRGAGGVSTVNILDSVTNIGVSAFSGCSSLISIEIPSSVTNIEDRAFNNCSSLKTITFEAGSSLTIIEIHAFANCSSLISIEIPSSVTNIEDWAFYNCSSLESISLPNSLTSIGDSVFNGCDNIKYNYYENGEYLGNSENTYLVLIDTVNTSFTEFNINTSCKIIYYSAFKSCSSITTITLPSSVTSIGDSAFRGCSSLTSIKIPSSVTNIKERAFLSCSLLKTVTFEAESKLTSIGMSTFSNCSSLTSIEIPSSVTSININAFNGCTSLKYIKITGNLTSSYSLPSGTWVKTDSPDEPSDWTTNVVRSIPRTNNVGYYHQQSAWQNAN